MTVYLSKYADIEKLYNLNNYKIIDCVNSKSDICYVFIRSAYLTPSTINDSFVETFPDNYEWENICKSNCIIKNAKKIIFIRDPLSLFYALGINSSIGSIDKVIEFVKRESEGLKVIIAGYSAGGYLAIILSSKLHNVDRVLAFGAPVNLLKWDGSQHMYAKEDCDFFTKNKNKYQYSYFDLSKTKFVFKNLFYFYGANNNVDCYQSSFLKDRDDVFMFPMDSEKHCGNVDPIALIFLLSCSNAKIKKLKNLTQKNSIFSSNRLILSLPLKFIYYAKKTIKRFKRLFMKLNH